MKKLLMLAAMLAMILVVSAPAMARHIDIDDDDDRIIFLRDHDRFDRFDRFDDRIDFAGEVAQGFEQETESGDVDLSFETTNEGDNSSVCAPALQFGNTGNVQNEQGVTLFDTNIDEVEFEAEDQFVFEPSNETACDQAVQQSSAASSS